MNQMTGSGTRTALEHIIFLTGRNMVTTCKALNITPQQFTDWIKKRRPIPAERLALLSAYFRIPAEMLADEKRFAKRLTGVSGVELEILAVTNRCLPCSNQAEKEELACWLRALEAKKEKQIRIERLAAILDREHAEDLEKIDVLLEELERGRSDEKKRGDEKR